MLALKSSITTTVKGCVSFWKNVIVLRLAVVEDREVVLLEVRHEPALRVGDGGEHGHDAACRSGRSACWPPDRAAAASQDDQRRPRVTEKAHSSELSNRRAPSKPSDPSSLTR